MIELRIPGKPTQIVPLIVLSADNISTVASQAIQQPDIQHEFEFILDSVASNVTDTGTVGSSSSIFASNPDETSDSE